MSTMCVLYLYNISVYRYSFVWEEKQYTKLGRKRKFPSLVAFEGHSNDSSGGGKDSSILLEDTSSP